MRHRQSGRHLGRTAAHRAALYRNLAKALLTSKLSRLLFQRQRNYVASLSHYHLSKG